MGGLTIDSSGDLFGTTVAGGSFNNEGTIFEMPSDGGKYDLGLETIHSFQGCDEIDPNNSANVLPANCIETDGMYPSGQLFVDSSGDVFGTAEQGGDPSVGDCGYDPSNDYNYTCGMVFELEPDSGAGNVNGYSPSPINLYSFTGGADGEIPIGGLTMHNGDLFGTTLLGSVSGTIFELPYDSGTSSYGTLVTLYSFPGGSDGGFPIAGVTADSSGDLFGVTELGGSGTCTFSSGGCGTIFELPYNSGASSYGALVTLYSFTGGNDGNFPVTNLLIDSSGNLYGTATFGGSNASASQCTTADASSDPSATGCGALFELLNNGTPSSPAYASSPTIIHQFGQKKTDSDGANPGLGNLFMDSAGNIFGTASGGGDSHGCTALGEPDPGLDAVPGCGAVFEFTP